MTIDFPTAPLAPGHRGAGRGAVENSNHASHTEFLTLLVRAQHVQTRRNEFAFRFNRRFYPFNAFRSLLGIAGHVTTPTYSEFYAK
jgi:hypothetical protein